MSGKMWLWYTAGRDPCSPSHRWSRYNSDISFLTCLSFIHTSCFLFNSGGPVCNVTTEILVCCYTRCCEVQNQYILPAVFEELYRLRRYYLLRSVHLLTVCIFSLPLDEAKKLPVSRRSPDFYFGGVCFESWSWRMLPPTGFRGLFRRFREIGKSDFWTRKICPFACTTRLR